MENIGYEKQLSTLLSLYNKAFADNGNISWAVNKKSNPDNLVKCTIPFVGRKYFSQAKKILIYASAENLTYYYKSTHESDLLDNDKNAENRHRLRFEQAADSVHPTFFPNVHLAPMSNGCLATAAYYIASKLLPDVPENPYDFYETIAFGNYAKYSIAGKTNKDYAKDKEKLEVSHAFVKADLEVLDPDYVIIPKTIRNTDYDWLEKVKGKALLIPISQLNARVINIHIAAKAKRNNILPPEISGPLSEWFNNISEVKKDNYRYVFSYLDNILEKL